MKRPFDLIVMEMRLLDLAGHELLGQLRTAGLATPIMVLSADTSTESKIQAFGHGADDYLEKPFHRDELLVRLRSLYRRATGSAANCFQIGRITVNTAEKIVQVDGKRISITRKEYLALELLAQRAGNAVSRVQFLEHLYQGEDVPEVKIIDIFVCKLRRKLAAALGDEVCIETVWGCGYMLRDPELEEAVA